MLFKSFVAFAAVQATCFAASSPYAFSPASQQTMVSLNTGEYYLFGGVEKSICWRYSANSGASYLSIGCQGGRSRRVQFCAEPSCVTKEPIVPDRTYYMVSDADGGSNELSCVRQSYGYGVGLSASSCSAEELDSRFSIKEVAAGIYTLFSSPYGELKIEDPWITPNGHGSVPFTLTPVAKIPGFAEGNST
ncbi:hypothetical protein BGW41_001383 [Actinomortierella wolfii]|nr:hypothetical protein BGW41_001383 [Actinomortierella wolfii]